MNQPTTIDNLRNPAPREAALPTVEMGFGTLQSFELMQRAAKMLTHSTLVPVAYRARTEVKEYGKVTGYEDNPNGLPNCVVALNMAQRMGADPLMVMQNLYIVEGRPSWSSQFIIAAINSCGRYSPLRFDLSKASEPQEVTYSATEWQEQAGGGKAKKVSVQKKIVVQHQSCVAWAIEKASGERLESPRISVQMAIDEGWLTKNGSKWQTMPEVMLRYRAAAFFGKLYAPELLMGLQTAEEVADIVDVNPDGSYTVSTPLEEARAARSPGARAAATRAPVAEEVASSVEKEATAAASEAEPKPAATQAPAQASQAHDQQDGFSFDEAGMITGIREEIDAANTAEELDLARSVIRDVTDESVKAELNALAAQRMRAINAGQSQASASTPTPSPAPQRRPRAPISAE